MTPLTSEIATIGNQRMKRRKSVKNTPIVPTNVPTSMMVGVNMPHDDGRKSRWSDVTMMTKRSNHMPMLMKIDSTNSAARDERTFLSQKSCGRITLQLTMVQ